MNSADTDVVGDTNGDGVVDELDTGLAGDTNGDGLVNSMDEIVGSDRNQDGKVDEMDGESTSLNHKPIDPSPSILPRWAFQPTLR